MVGKPGGTFASVESRGDAEDALLLDTGTLDRSKVYRFVQERRELLARRRAQGYELVLRSEHKVRLVTDSLDGSSEDQIRVGDTVLMMVDKSLYNERRRRTTKFSEARLGATEQVFRDNAAKRGVRSVQGDEGE